VEPPATAEVSEEVRALAQRILASDVRNPAIRYPLTNELRGLLGDPDAQPAVEALIGSASAGLLQKLGELLRFRCRNPECRVMEMVEFPEQPAWLQSAVLEVLREETTARATAALAFFDGMRDPRELESAQVQAVAAAATHVIAAGLQDALLDHEARTMYLHAATCYAQLVVASGVVDPEVIAELKAVALQRSESTGQQVRYQLMQSDLLVSADLIIEALGSPDQEDQILGLRGLHHALGFGDGPPSGIHDLEAERQVLLQLEQVVLSDPRLRSTRAAKDAMLSACLGMQAPEARNQFLTSWASTVTDDDERAFLVRLTNDLMAGQTPPEMDPHRRRPPWCR
jgi:hypothetical protein